MWLGLMLARTLFRKLDMVPVCVVLCEVALTLRSVVLRLLIRVSSIVFVVFSVRWRWVVNPWVRQSWSVGTVPIGWLLRKWLRLVVSVSVEGQCCLWLGLTVWCMMVWSLCGTVLSAWCVVVSLLWVLLLFSSVMSLLCCGVGGLSVLSAVFGSSSRSSIMLTVQMLAWALILCGLLMSRLGSTKGLALMCLREGAAVSALLMLTVMLKLTTPGRGCLLIILISMPVGPRLWRMTLCRRVRRVLWVSVVMIVICACRLGAVVWYYRLSGVLLTYLTVNYGQLLVAWLVLRTAVTVGRPTRVRIRCLILKQVLVMGFVTCRSTSPSVMCCRSGLIRLVRQIRFTLFLLSG